MEYRLDRRGPRTVVILHGGHIRTGLSWGEEVFAARDCTVLVPSRPGHGDTPLTGDDTPAGFADRVAELCERLGVGQAEAVVGSPREVPPRWHWPPGIPLSRPDWS